MFSFTKRGGKSNCGSEYSAEPIKLINSKCGCVTTTRLSLERFRELTGDPNWVLLIQEPGKIVQAPEMEQREQVVVQEGLNKLAKEVGRVLEEQNVPGDKWLVLPTRWVDLINNSPTRPGIATVTCERNSDGSFTVVALDNFLNGEGVIRKFGIKVW